MGILFRYKNALSSSDFNRRFADVLGKSIMQGFYLEKGTGDFDVTITSGSDSSNLLITRTGARIEDQNILINALEVEPNATGIIRIDTVYAKYIHGDRDAIVEYVVAKGTPEGEAAFAESADTHTLIGYVNVPTESATLESATFTHPTRGIHLKDVANPVTFKEPATFSKNIIVPTPTTDQQAVNKVYVDDALNQLQEAFPYTEVTSSLFNEDKRVFEEVLYKREDGTKLFESALSNPDVDGRFTTITLRRFGADGVTEVDFETWILTYDEFGNILSKTRE
jgi:hypothetical protein